MASDDAPAGDGVATGVELELTPSEAMLEQLVAEGTDVAFGIVGSGFMDVLDIMPLSGIDYIGVRHENNGGHMADGYAQALRGQKPAVLIGQAGPGVTNFLTSVKTAQLNHSPMVLFTPTATTAALGTDALQEADTMSIYGDAVEWQGHIESNDRIAEYVRTAFRQTHANQGPAQVSFARDRLYDDISATILEPDQYRETDPTPPREANVEEAAEVIAGAETPAIMAGYGVVKSGAVDEVAELAERLNAPVANTIWHNDSFPQSHPLGVGPLGFQGSKAGMELVSEADVLVAVGSRLNSFGLLPSRRLDWFPEDAEIIQIDVDPAQIGRTVPIEVGVVGDAKRTTADLLAALDDHSDVGAPPERAEDVQRRFDTWKDELRAEAATDQVPISPERALWDINETLPPGTMVAAEPGNIGAQSHAFLEFEEPGNYISAGQFACIGFAWPAAIGAAVARPDDDAVAVVGDGSFSMTLPALLTAVEHDIPATAVVMNNQEWGAEKTNQDWFYNERFVGTNLTEPAFEEVARAVGAHGVRVEDPDELVPALEDALGIDRPSVINVMVDPEGLAEPARRDALDEPRRRLQKYRQPGDPNFGADSEEAPSPTQAPQEQ